MLARRRFTGLLSAAVLSAPAVARAREEYPARSIRLIVPWPPGGGVDAFGRVVQAALGEQLGQTVVIDNIGGGSGRIGTQTAARAAAAAVLGGAAHPAPAPGATVPAVSGLTASATAANVLARLGLPDHCAAKLGYGFDWAARMTPLLPIYPHGHVEEAAGSDAPGCAMRVVTFLTPIPPGEVADFYWSRAATAGFTPLRSSAGTDDLIAARRGPAAFASAIRSQGGLTEVDLVTFGL